MKKVLAFLAAVSMISGSAYAVGAVNLTTYDAGMPIFYLTSGTLASGSDFYAQVLYNGSPLANNKGESTFPIFDGDFDGGYADIPGVADNAPDVNLTLRAWKGTAGYDAALERGSLTWSQTVGADPGAPATPTNTGMNLPSSLVISPIPEPSTIALGMLGAAALLIRRRK